jgi:hypothetical protein
VNVNIRAEGERQRRKERDEKSGGAKRGIYDLLFDRLTSPCVYAFCGELIAPHRPEF